MTFYKEVGDLVIGSDPKINGRFTLQEKSNPNSLIRIYSEDLYLWSHHAKVNMVPKGDLIHSTVSREKKWEDLLASLRGQGVNVVSTSPGYCSILDIDEEGKLLIYMSKGVGSYRKISCTIGELSYVILFLSRISNNLSKVEDWKRNLNSDDFRLLGEKYPIVKYSTEELSIFVWDEIYEREHERASSTAGVIYTKRGI